MCKETGWERGWRWEEWGGGVGGGGVLGRGGMVTKVRAARLAAKSGCPTLIASGESDNVLAPILPSFETSESPVIPLIIEKRTKGTAIIFKMLMKYGFKLGDVNGVNLSHLHKNEKGRIVVDDEMLETMAKAGFDRLPRHKIRAS